MKALPLPYIFNQKASYLVVTFIIDDDKLHHLGMKRMLHHLTVPTTILQFYNGLQAIEYLEQHKTENDSLPDVIFLDINMPVMNGWQFLDAFIKINLDAAKKITIYLVTSSVDTEEIRRAAYYKEISKYIIKPVLTDNLNDLFKTIV